MDAQTGQIDCAIGYRMTLSFLPSKDAYTKAPNKKESYLYYPYFYEEKRGELKNYLIKSVENCLWPFINNEFNVNGITDLEIEVAVDRLLETCPELPNCARDTDGFYWLLTEIKDIETSDTSRNHPTTPRNHFCKGQDKRLCGS